MTEVSVLDVVLRDLSDVLLDALASGIGGDGASRLGIIFAWTMAAAYLLAGAHHLRLFDFRSAEQREPLWLTEGTGYPVAVNVLIAVSEEVVFRGYLQTYALSVADPVYSLFAVNLVFALIHLKGGLTFALSAGFFGMMASVMTLASASLLPAIVMHGGWNFLIGIARRREAARLLASETAPGAASL